MTVIDAADLGCERCNHRARYHRDESKECREVACRCPRFVPAELSVSVVADD